MYHNGLHTTYPDNDRRASDSRQGTRPWYNSARNKFVAYIPQGTPRQMDFNKNYLRLLLATGSTLAVVLASAMVTATGTDNTAASEPSSHCQSFVSSNLYRKPLKSYEANPSNWIEVIKRAESGSEILLVDGDYSLDRYAVVLDKALTLRSKSGKRDAVVIVGQGYMEKAEALMVLADDVRIADLSVRNIRDHAVAIKKDAANTVLYGLDLMDIGTQHVKASSPGENGVIACSRIGYSKDGALGDYNGAIDLIGAVRWTIRDNYIYNIWGDGSGCLVDTDCGTYLPGGGPAILLWRGASENIVTRNVIVNSFRGIALGLHTDYRGGLVADNTIVSNLTGKQGVNGLIKSDAGISLMQANDVLVENNRVILNHDYPGGIEVKDGVGNIIRNNVLTHPIWDRGNAEYNGCGSYTGTACGVENNTYDANNIVIDKIPGGARQVAELPDH